MRVLVPRRFIRLGILLVVLCLTSALPQSVYAKPYGWQDKDSPNPPAPNGDGDGTVVKSVTLGNSVAFDAFDAAGVANGRSVGSMVWTYIRMLRLGYGLRWFW